MERHVNPLDLFSCVLMVTSPKKSIWKLKLKTNSIWGCWDLGSSCRVRSERLGRKRGNYCRGYNNEHLAAARRPSILRRVSSRRWGRVHETGASWADDFRGSSSPRGTSVPLSLNILQETAPAVQACVCAQGEDMCAFLSNRMKSWVGTLWPALTNLSLIVGVEVQEVWRGWARAYCC